MKLCESPTKIIGITVGELSLDLIRAGAVSLKVRFALVTDDGPVGFMDVAELGSTGWSQKSLDAMRVFTEALEEDALQLIFKAPSQGAETPQPDTIEGPAQF